MRDLINWLVLSIFGAKKTEKSNVNNVVEGLETNMYITYESYITASGKYQDRLIHSELTQELIDNANKLCDTLNSFFVELGEVKEITVSSGFRPSEVNKNTQGAAKKSNHMVCLACDIEDHDSRLDDLMLKKLDLLKKHGLYLEDPKSTVGWCHLQCVAPKSGKRVFIP